MIFVTWFLLIFGACFVIWSLADECFDSCENPDCENCPFSCKESDV